MEESSQKKLTDLLASMGVAKIAEFLQREQLSRLEALGIEITARTSAEFFAAESGVDVMKNAKLRLELFMTRDTKDLLSFLGGDDATLGDALLAFNKFSWGDNSKSRDCLRFFGLKPELLDRPRLDRAASFTIPVEKPLHKYQNWLRKSILEALNDTEIKRFILHMPTGSGKTRTSLEAVVDFVRGLRNSDTVVVWFAHSDELCEQACESIANIWEAHGSEPSQLIKLWGGRATVPLAGVGPKFVVTSFQTAYKILHTDNDERFAMFAAIRRQCSVLVIDEAHQSTAPTYQDAIELFSNSNTKIVGLTATPGRHHVGQAGDDTLDLASFYDGNKIDILDDEGKKLGNPIQFLTNNGILSQADRYQLNSGQDFELSASEIRHISEQLDIPAKVLKRIGKNAARTDLVATHAAHLVREYNCSVIIFAPSKDNAVELASLLLYSGIDAASVTGESSPISRRDSIKSFKDGDLSVLVNFGVLTTGFDAPNIDAVIVARPTTSVVLYSQMIGRGLRGPSMGGTKTCKIIDVVDNILNMPRSDDAFRYFDEFYD
jgi:DNA repair protein RadD